MLNISSVTSLSVPEYHHCKGKSINGYFKPREFNLAEGSKLNMDTCVPGTALKLPYRKNPEKYTNLQVRVCGWNLRFIDLAPEEQQIFIDRAGDDESC